MTTSDHQDASDAGRKAVIGLAGGIGSGKSTVARAFAELGCYVSDSDAQAHAALNEPEVVAEIRDWLGDEVIDKQGRPDRRAIGRKVFGHPEAVERLNGLIHPRVHAMRHAEIARIADDPAVPAIVLDTPLLFEADVADECDAIVFVDAPLDVRRQRVAESRGWDAEELERRQSHQMGLQKKRGRCDYVIANGRDQSDLREQAQRILDGVLQRHAKGRNRDG